jgi:hypothetical protein
VGSGIRLDLATGQAPEKGEEGKVRLTQSGKNASLRTAQILVHGLPLIERTTLRFPDFRHEHHSYKTFPGGRLIGDCDDIGNHLWSFFLRLF